MFERFTRALQEYRHFWREPGRLLSADGIGDYQKTLRVLVDASQLELLVVEHQNSLLGVEVVDASKGVLHLIVDGEGPRIVFWSQP